MKTKLKLWNRNCPKCNCLLEYGSKSNLKRAVDNNSLCSTCASLGQYVSDETKKKISIANNGVVRSVEFKKNASEKNKGQIPWILGRHHTKESKKTVSRKLKGRIYSEETLKKMRLGAIKRISNSYFNGGQVFPNYNSSSISILEQKAKELNIVDLQHAENGGEYFIEELGYWVDGYSKEKNIVIEYYERHHNTQIKKDLQRQAEITKLLNCEFIIIKESYGK